MVKKRNKRTRKKYKKRGGFTDEQLDKCNIRLERQGVKSRVRRLKMCNDSNATADLDTQEPAPVQPDQTIAQPKQPTELKQSSGVQSIIAPLEEEPEQPTQPVQGPGIQSVIAPLEEEPKKPSIKDRASALEKKFGKTGMRKTRKALKTTIGACRAAVDKKGRKYYYNEANERTWNPNDEVCHPKEGIEKTGNKSGDCIGARYKGGEEYWYHPTKQFSTHNKNHPGCFPDKILKAKLASSELFQKEEGIIIDTGTVKKPKKKKKKKRRTRKSHERAASKKNRRKQMKENEERKKKQGHSGGRRRTKRKKSRKRRR
jgi:hypothetical protein